MQWLFPAITFTVLLIVVLFIVGYNQQRKVNDFLKDCAIRVIVQKSTWCAKAPHLSVFLKIKQPREEDVDAIELHLVVLHDVWMQGYPELHADALTEWVDRHYPGYRRVSFYASTTATDLEKV